MHPVNDLHVHPVNENTLTICVGDSIDREINNRVFKIYHQLLKNRHAWWLDIIPAYATISIVYDVLAIRKQHVSAFDWMKTQIETLVQDIPEGNAVPLRHVQVPVCYDAAFAWDAERIRQEKNISMDELVSLHTSKVYHVFMIGFLPGFAYMGSVDPRIAIPRIPTPRTKVPVGSVGIAGEQTGIYPLESPGGWNIIGKTPLKIFDQEAATPVLFRPGDQVTFTPIAKKEYDSFNPSAFKFLIDEH
jgi:inhibitor of KinA